MRKKQQKLQGKCDGCGKRRVLRKEAIYRLCDECRSNREVMRKLKVYRFSDLCTCTHTAERHRSTEASSLYDCLAEGCECMQFRYSPA